MVKLLSKELELGDKLDVLGTFDPILNLDSNYFINIKRLKHTKVLEFEKSYFKIDEFFSDLGLLLANSTRVGDKPFSAAYRKFYFPEVNGINLGFSKGNHGNGFGKKLRMKIIEDAKEIIDLGFNEPELFHLIGLFEENVGPDRLSDMIARIILKDIEAYTLGVYAECGINENNYPAYEFNKYGFLINPYKLNKTVVLLLPQDILHELPISYGWNNIDEVYLMNTEVREEFNRIVGNNWKDLESKEKKKFIREKIFTDIDLIEHLILKYKGEGLSAYDFVSDKVGDYYIPRMLSKMLADEKKEDVHNLLDSFSITMFICEKFKNFVENKKGYELFYDENSKARREYVMQRAFYLAADIYCDVSDLDITPEADGGRGPVDFKMSRGNDKTIVEMKLTTNPQLIHGYEVQIEEYAKAERTNNRIYMVIDNNGPIERLKKLQQIHNERIKKGEKAPTLIIVSALPKKSASKY